ncbi:MAG: 16S rRNA (adenine(1518)-N(6)/adenine(1519)-N(6))-dimethyltransferase RsmA [Rickettsiales bacterium]
MYKYRDFVKNFSGTPQKKYGQNFLVEEFYLEKICKYSQINALDNIIEVGPGLGFLTEKILDCSPNKLDCIEIDKNLYSNLKTRVQGRENVHLHNVDAMQYDFSTILNAESKIVANLPYNISVPLLMRIAKDFVISPSMFVLLQKEVAERICAKEGKKYGAVSVIMNFLFNTQQLFDVPPESFLPAPKVNSTFIKIIPKSDITERRKLVFKLEKLCKLAFSQRRKTFIKTLAQYNCKNISLENLLEDMYINKGDRPEEISVSQYVSLVSFLDKQKLI